MSRRNRHLLESTPLPTLPEVDTSSTIDYALHLNVNSLLNGVSSEGGRYDPADSTLREDAKPRRHLPDDTTGKFQSAFSHNSSAVKPETHQQKSTSHNVLTTSLAEKPSPDQPIDFFADVPFPSHTTLNLSEVRETLDRRLPHEDHLTRQRAAGPFAKPNSFLKGIRTAATNLSSTSVARFYNFNPASHLDQTCQNPPTLHGNELYFGQRRSEMDQEDHEAHKGPVTYLPAGESAQSLADQQNIPSSVYYSSPPIANSANTSTGHCRIAHDATRPKQYSGATNMSEYLADPHRAPDNPSSTRRTINRPSMVEGSTVANIYKHYCPEISLSNLSDNSSISDISMTFPEVKPSSPSEFGKQRREATTATRADRVPHTMFKEKLLRTENYANTSPPKFSLPNLPTANQDPQSLLSSSTLGLGQGSSYGDTYKLLNIQDLRNNANVESPLPTLDAKSGSRLRIGDKISKASSYDLPPTSKSTKVSMVAPKVIINQADGGCFDYEQIENSSNGKGNSRMPLEREVSHALRRTSDSVGISNGSVADSIIDRYRYFGQDDFQILSSDSEILFPQVGEAWSLKIPDGSANPQLDNFYDPNALSSSWVHGTQGAAIRIPIIKKDHLMHLPVAESEGSGLPTKTFNQKVPSAEEAEITTTFEDNKDWETIRTRTSVLGVHDRASDYGLIGGMIGRAGSSIADTSDAGFDSTLEIENLQSTSRIAQHPAHELFKADYCQRNLKDTKAPIFAPKYRMHNVNGFLANSSRLQPQPSLANHATQNLTKSHINPFHRPPPHILTLPDPSAAPASKVYKSQAPKSSRRTLNTEIDENDYTDVIVPPSSFQRLSTEDRKRKTLEWMESFDRYKLDVKVGSQRQRNPSRIPASSSIREAIDTVAKNISNFFSNQDLHSQSGSNAKLRELSLPKKMRLDGSEISRSTLYRQRPDLDAKSQDRSSHREFELRSLSLVEKCQPSTPQSLSSTQRLGGSLSDDFVYRSPLAPPRRPTWKILYSPSQLFGFQQTAESDGIVQTSRQRTALGVTADTQPGGSRRRIFEKPTLRLWKRDEDTRTDLTHQKTNCSTLVLCVCTIFPPLLLLYIFGGLDGIISWWTKGSYTTFARAQKRLALIFLIVWSTAVFIGLVVFLIYWFTRLR